MSNLLYLVAFHHSLSFRLFSSFWSVLGRVDGPQKFESDLDFVKPFAAAYFYWKFPEKTRLDFRHTRQEYHQPIVLAMVQRYLNHLLIKHVIFSLDYCNSKSMKNLATFRHNAHII